jgi:hypothetical protein
VYFLSIRQDEALARRETPHQRDIMLFTTTRRARLARLDRFQICKPKPPVQSVQTQQSALQQQVRGILNHKIDAHCTDTVKTPSITQPQERHTCHTYQRTRRLVAAMRLPLATAVKSIWYKMGRRPPPPAAPGADPR